jgi:hypothetical protein
MEAEAVITDVMVARVPKKTVRSGTEQCVAEQRTAAEVDDAGHVLMHPRLGDGAGVGLTAHIKKRHRPVRISADILSRPFIGFDNAQAQGIAFRYYLTQSRLEKLGIDRP